MKIGTSSTSWILTGLALLGASCNTQLTTTGSTSASIESAEQDLDLDPTGMTTVLSFSGASSILDISQIESDGGQTVVSAVALGEDLAVTWDDRVTPTHRVRVLSSTVTSTWKGVTTSDPSAPTIQVTSANQDTTDSVLGGDSMQVSFGGARLVNSGVQDLSNWQLTVAGQIVDLAGSAISYNPATGVADFLLGPTACLHADFSIAVSGLISVADVAVDSNPVQGSATGDAVAPNLLSVTQRLDVDEYGCVLDFQFDEAMDPNNCLTPGRFSVVDHPAADGYTFVVSVQQPSDSTLRVSFARPVAPNYDLIAHAGLMDSHGNGLAAAQEAFTSTHAPNGFASVTAVTNANTGGDQILAVFDQAIDPDFAADPSRWALSVDGSSVDMTAQTYTYDFTTKTLTLDLDFDMRNGDSVVLDAIAQVDVDGEDFTLQAGSVNAAGDGIAPSILSVTQNRNVDPDGYTADVLFSEDVHSVQAQDTSNYVLAPASSLVSAVLLADGCTVRIVSSDRIMTPGDVALSVDADVDDLAGNAMGTISGPHSPNSTDQTKPVALGVAATIEEGADNDILSVTYDDDMVAADVLDLSSWSFESPVGSVQDLSGCSVVYDAANRCATVTLTTPGLYLKQADSLQVSFTGMRDIGGNAIETGSVLGSLTSEYRRPAVSSVWRQDVPSDNTLCVRFDEACDGLDDLYDAVSNPYGTRFALRQAGVLRAYPDSATVIDGGLGVLLSYPVSVSLTDTVDVLGNTDLAGNLLFPALANPVAGADSSSPGFGSTPIATAVSGEDNDTIVVEFSTPMAPWGITDADHYSLSTNPGGTPVDLTNATLEWDGVAQVTMTLGQAQGEELQSNQNYDVTLNALAGDPLRTLQGVALGANQTQVVAVSGDVITGPTQAATSVCLDKQYANALLVIFDEAVNSSAAEVASNYDYGPGMLADSATLASPKVVRVQFATPVAAGGSLVIAQASAQDLAGNLTGGDMTLLVIDDSTEPSLVAVSGLSQEGQGGDEVHVSFDGTVDLASALDPLRYAISNGGGSFNMSTVSTHWDSTSHSVVLSFPGGQELNPNAGLTVTVGNVADSAGNFLSAPVALGGVVTGDQTPPSIAGAFVHFALDAAGTTVDLTFSEDVQTDFCADLSRWSTTGVAGILGVDVLGADHVRLTLSQGLNTGESLVLAGGQADLAQNVAGALQVQPVAPQD